MDILNFISWIKGGRQVTTVDPSKTLLPVGLKDGRRDDSYLAGAISVTDFLNLVPTGLEGTSYILVNGKGTSEENGAELQAAYDAAKIITPSVGNRYTILVAPGDYYFPDNNNQFIIDANDIDIISLSGIADVYLSGVSVVAVKDVYLKGLNTSQAITLGGVQAGFNITNNSGQVYDTCVGGDFSFGYGGEISGTFINCTAGNFSFCSAPTAGFPPIGITEQSGDPILSGILTDCTAGFNSFGHSDMNFNTAVTGTLTNCTAGDASFGSAPGQFYGTVSGILTNCKGGELSFGIAGIISGTLTNCKATGPNSFGGYIEPTAVFYNCIGTDNCFAGSFMQYFAGKAYNCIGGQNTFGNRDTGPGAPANFIDTFSGGRVSYCTKTIGVFPGASTSGANSVIACQDLNGLQTF
jgi:hypothetical protein